MATTSSTSSSAPAEPYEGRLFINNEYVEAQSHRTLPLTNPATQQPLPTTLHLAGATDIDAAVAAARAAFPAWRRTPAPARARLLHRLADLLDTPSTIARLATLESVCMGMPVAVATHILSSGMAGASYWRYMAGWADKLSGSFHAPDVAGDAAARLVTYEPLGVCAAVASWNATFMYVAMKIAPAVAAGNTVVFKASEKSPLGALAFAALVKEAGFPPGVVNFVSGDGEAGAALAGHMDVDKISFTGSLETGRKVMEAAARSNLKKVTLELGGKSAALVFADANLERVLTHMSQSFLLNSGQICAATTRLLVQAEIADKVVAGLKERFEALHAALGDPAAPTTFLGPLADEAQFGRVMGFLDRARADGLNVLTGGCRHGDRGWYVQPTIILDPPADSSVYRDEIFGPVLAIKTFADEAEAIALANDSTYGLAGSVYTSDITRALRVAGELEVGNVSINRSVVPSFDTPFGGWKMSGLGREGGEKGIMAYVQAKTVSIDMSQ